jgi:hypothetical protein
VVGVNRAGLLVECDWLVCVDPGGWRRNFGDGGLVGDPRLFTSPESMGKDVDGVPWLPLGVWSRAMTYADERIGMDKDLLVNTYSSISALALCGWLGSEDGMKDEGVRSDRRLGVDGVVSEVYLYGYDLCGGNDWDGWSDGRRDDHRWEHEGYLMLCAFQYLESLGIRVRRVTSELFTEGVMLGEFLRESLGRYTIDLDDDELPLCEQVS